jgi:uncharacterized phosphosugar-binding protein
LGGDVVVIEQGDVVMDARAHDGDGSFMAAKFAGVVGGAGVGAAVVVLGAAGIFSVVELQGGELPYDGLT